jgi:glycerol-3-phosphate acyltransferase PlsY
MMALVQVLACALAGYLVASVPIGLVVGRVAGGVDIRRFGTGNIGASNTYRNIGLGAASVVGVGTFLQGLVPVLAAGLLTGSDLGRGAAALSVVLGYGWSWLLRLRGGSAVGTATGALAALFPLGLVPLLTCYALGGVLRRPAPGVLAGLLAFVATMAAAGQPRTLVAAALLVVAAVVYKRLEGVRGDLHDLHGERAVAAVIDRLIHDRKPGRRLVGPIE